MWYFGSRFDGHDDPTPNRDVLKEELEGNADVQRTVVGGEEDFVAFSYSKEKHLKMRKCYIKKKEYFAFTSEVIGEDFKVVIRDD